MCRIWYLERLIASSWNIGISKSFVVIESQNLEVFCLVLLILESYTFAPNPACIFLVILGICFLSALFFLLQ